MKKALAMVLAAAMVLGTASMAMAEDAGFEETPIFYYDEDGNELEEVDIGVLHIAAVYFQPVDMEPADQAGLAKEESNLHLEADIHFNETIAEEANDVGFGAGDWVPYMTVDYSIVSETDGTVAAEGSFMPMSASDGPHYGANLLVEKDDTYTLTFTIHNPQENGYLLHVDEETGVKGGFWDEPIVVEFTGWEYTVQDW